MEELDVTDEEEARECESLLFDAFFEAFLDC
jgi:hypothetical protein